MCEASKVPKAGLAGSEVVGLGLGSIMRSPGDEYRRGMFEVFLQGLDHGGGIIAVDESMIE